MFITLADRPPTSQNYAKSAVANTVRDPLDGGKGKTPRNINRGTKSQPIPWALGGVETAEHVPPDRLNVTLVGDTGCCSPGGSPHPEPDSRGNNTNLDGTTRGECLYSIKRYMI